MLDVDGGRALHLLSRGEDTSTTRRSRQKQIFRLIAKMPTLAALAYRHSHGPALRLPGQRPQLRRELPPDDVPGDRAQLQGHPVLEQALEVLFILHADHEQNCSTNAMRARGIVGRRSLLGDAGRHRRPLRPAARRGQRAGPAHARGDRLQGQDPRVHQGSEDERGRGPAHGLRPPRVQELRPAGQDHQGHGRPRVRGDAAATRCSTSRSSSSGSPSRTSTSSSASSIRTSTSTRA